MTDEAIEINGVTLNVDVMGDGPPIVLLHGLGMNNSIWDDLRFLLPDHRLIMPDLRGHGASDVPDGPYTMGGLINDIEGVLDGLNVRDAVVIGLSLGGMIAQGLAVKRLDLVRGLVLCCTAAKFGQPEPWQTRAKTARTQGMSAPRDEMLARWNVTTDAADTRLMNTAPEGFAATCEAIAGTDFYTPTSGLRLPTLGLAGDKDKSTPPDLVRETTDLVPGSDFHLIRGAGHLAPETHAPQVAKHLHDFLAQIGHT